MSDRVRHLDLVARFKWAIEIAAIDDDVLALEAVEALRALIPAIEHRIAETVDAPGPGIRPDGKPVDVHRLADALVSVGPIELVERRRSLPRLKAQALFELGRLLTSFTFSSSMAGFEEAHEVFERASIAFQAVADPRLSAACAVAAAQCLAWLVDDPTGPHARRLFDYGPAAHRQVWRSSAGSPEVHRPPLSYRGTGPSPELRSTSSASVTAHCLYQRRSDSVVQPIVSATRSRSIPARISDSA